MEELIIFGFVAVLIWNLILSFCLSSAYTEIEELRHYGKSYDKYAREKIHDAEGYVREIMDHLNLEICIQKKRLCKKRKP